MAPSIVVGLNAVIVAVTDEEPRLLTVERSDHGMAGRGAHEPALPFGPLDPAGHRTLELGLRAWVREQTGLELGYVEQLYTFADRHRDPRERAGGPRMVSIAYLALVREGRVAGRRAGALAGLLRVPALGGRPRGAAGAPREGDRPRARALGGGGAGRRDPAGAAARGPTSPSASAGRPSTPCGCWSATSCSTRPGSSPSPGATGSRPPGGALPPLGEPMALDHRRLLATALGRLRGKLKYRPVVFELLPATFTLLRLQRVVEALAGARLHKQNFRRLVEKGGLVEGTGVVEPGTVGRPAELFRFRREVLRERRAPGRGPAGQAPRSRSEPAIAGP